MEWLPPTLRLLQNSRERAAMRGKPGQRQLAQKAGVNRERINIDRDNMELSLHREGTSQMAGLMKYPNKVRELRLAHRPNPWTQDRLIVAIEQVARELAVNIAERKSLKTNLSRWENGHIRIGTEYRRVLRCIFHCSDADLGFHEGAARGTLGAQLEPVSFRESWIEAFETYSAEWENDVDRRGFVQGAAYAAVASTSPALQWLIGQGEEIARADGSFSVGSAHVESIREMTATFRRLDNRFGGGHARESVVRYLSAEVAPLITRGRYPASVGSSLLSAGAEALQLAGWMAYDAGLQGLGQRYMSQALRLAKAADDGPLGAEILAGLSHQASYLKDAATAIDLARAAQQTARQHGLDALLAEAAVMEAHGHACAGDSAACTRALGFAETTLDKAERGGDPQWIGYFDEAYLAAKFGHCFKELRDAKTAQRFAERSLDMDNSYLRGRAFNLALLATAHAQAGEVETACAVGTEAAGLIKEMKSARALEYLRGLRRELAPYASAPSVVALDATTAPLLAQAS